MGAPLRARDLAVAAGIFRPNCRGDGALSRGQLERSGGARTPFFRELLLRPDAAHLTVRGEEPVGFAARAARDGELRRGTLGLLLARSAPFRTCRRARGCVDARPRRERGAWLLGGAFHALRTVRGRACVAVVAGRRARAHRSALRRGGLVALAARRARARHGWCAIALGGRCTRSAVRWLHALE